MPATAIVLKVIIFLKRQTLYPNMFYLPGTALQTPLCSRIHVVAIAGLITILFLIPVIHLLFC
jgi:hypothetical protein